MKAPFHSSLILGATLLAALSILVTLNHLTKDRIAVSQQAEQRRLLSQVLPPGPFDNDVLATQRQHLHPEPGSPEPLTVYSVFRDEQPLACVLEVVAPDGYNGDIRLLLGLSYAGELIGVRVITHQETPGFADAIDARRSDWITQFNGRSLTNTGSQAWDVRPYQGDFDALTGATVTPRAIVLSVHRTLRWYRSNREQVFGL